MSVHLHMEKGRERWSDTTSFPITKDTGEERKEKQKGWIALLKLVKQLLECGIDLLGFSAPDKM